MALDLKALSTIQQKNLIAMKAYIVLIYFMFVPFFVFSQIYNGIWQSEGYGQILEISDNDADFYQVTQISNIFDDTYPINGNELGIGEDFMGYLEIVNNQLKLTLAGGTIMTFNELNALPSITQDTDDPLVNFNIFWQTYEDWCALFPILSVNWQAEYDAYVSQINSSTTIAELFNYMTEMLAKLNDGHSYLDAGGNLYFERGPVTGDLWDEYSSEMMDLIESEYIDGGNFIESNSEILYYGTINDSIGYLYIYEMEGFAPTDNELDDNVVCAAEIDAALTYLQNTKALVIDLRFNTGGYDSNSRLIANRLTKEQMPVYSKQARVGAYDEFADSLVFYIEPDGVQYVDRPVVVLTSDLTLSAADVFAMITKEIDCVTLIGETTYGILSDSYTKYLPNGWDFGISPERYKDVQNINYEQAGIPPDIEVIGSMDAFNNGQDNILETTLVEIFNLCTISSTAEVSLIDNARLYPNPADELITVEINEISISPFNWEVCDIHGSVLSKGISSSNKFQIQTEALPMGFYYLILKQGNQVATRSFSVLK